MTTVVMSSLAIQPDTLVIVSVALRSFLGLSRDGSYLHHVRPVRFEEPIVATGLRKPGDLTCDCRGGAVRGTCYWTRRAEAFEGATGLADNVDPVFVARDRLASFGEAVFDAPAGAGEEVQPWRG